MKTLNVCEERFGITNLQMLDSQDGGGGDTGSLSCFPAGTQILMSDRTTKPIELIDIGDIIMSYDGSNIVEVNVEEIESPVRDHLYVLKFEDNSILKLTREHPLYTTKGLKSLSPVSTKQENSNLIVGALELGDLVITSNGFQKLTDIEYVVGEIQTYNIKKLSEHNNYFVNGFLAHNKALQNKNTFIKITLEVPSFN